MSFYRDEGLGYGIAEISYKRLQRPGGPVSGRRRNARYRRLNEGGPGGTSSNDGHGHDSAIARKGPAGAVAITVEAGSIVAF